MVLAQRIRSLEGFRHYLPIRAAWIASETTTSTWSVAPGRDTDGTADAPGVGAGQVSVFMSVLDVRSCVRQEASRPKHLAH